MQGARVSLVNATTSQAMPSEGSEMNLSTAIVSCSVETDCLRDSPDNASVRRKELIPLRFVIYGKSGVTDVARPHEGSRGGAALAPPASSSALNGLSQCWTGWPDTTRTHSRPAGRVG